WTLPGLHGQDPVQLLHGSGAEGRAFPPCRARARTAGLGGGGVHRGDLRRDHDDARPAEGPLGQHHPAGRAGPGGGAVLTGGRNAPGSSTVPEGPQPTGARAMSAAPPPQPTKPRIDGVVATGATATGATAIGASSTGA